MKMSELVRDVLSESKDGLGTDEQKEFVSKVEDIFRKEVKEGWIKASVVQIVGEPFISIKFGFVGQNGKVHPKLRYGENDPAKTSISIIPKGEKHEMKTSGGRVYCKPSEGSYMAMEPHGKKWRKATNTLDKLLKTFEKNLKELKKTWKAQEGNVYGDPDSKYFK